MTPGYLGRGILGMSLQDEVLRQTQNTLHVISPVCPATDSVHSGEILSLRRPWNTSVLPWLSWMRWLERESLCLSYHRLKIWYTNCCDSLFLSLNRWHITVSGFCLHFPHFWFWHVFGALDSDEGLAVTTHPVTTFPAQSVAHCSSTSHFWITLDHLEPASMGTKKVPGSRT